MPPLIEEDDSDDELPLSELLDKTRASLVQSDRFSSMKSDSSFAVPSKSIRSMPMSSREASPQISKKHHQKTTKSSASEKSHRHLDRETNELVKQISNISMKKDDANTTKLIERNPGSKRKQGSLEIPSLRAVDPSDISEDSRSLKVLDKQILKIPNNAEFPSPDVSVDSVESVVIEAKKEPEHPTLAESISADIPKLHESRQAFLDHAYKEMLQATTGNVDLAFPLAAQLSAPKVESDAYATDIKQDEQNNEFAPVRKKSKSSTKNPSKNKWTFKSLFKKRTAIKQKDKESFE